MVSITSLYYFCVVAEELSFSRASKRLFISQQALSTHIAKIESHYNILLFDRTHPMTLTEPGRILLKYAKAILSLFDDFSRELQDIKDFNQGELTLGIPVTRGTVMLPPLLSAFHTRFPQIKLNLQEGETDEVIDRLHNGEVDLYIGYRPENCSGLSVITLFKEQFLLLLPKQFLECIPALPQDGPVSIELFANVPFVAQEDSTMNGAVFKHLCKQADISPEIIVTTKNLITQTSLCLEGLGACIIPATFLSIQPQLQVFGNTPLWGNGSLNQIATFLLESSSIGDFQIVICRRQNKLLTRAGQEFIRITKDLYSKLPISQTPPQPRYEPDQ